MGKKRGGSRKHIPQRTCLVCRESKPKRQLTRLVRVDDHVVIDPTGKVSGRGAYLCDLVTCRERAAKSDLIDRALRIDLTKDDREQLAVQLGAVS